MGTIRFIGKIFTSSGFKIAIPFITVAVGLVFLATGVFVDFDNPKVHELFLLIGKSLLAGGVVAAIIKSMQFTGLFKSELTEVIFEPKFLENRKDLQSYWEKVSMELFKNKFPDISAKLLKDISTIYFPTNASVYHDGAE